MINCSGDSSSASSVELEAYSDESWLAVDLRLLKHWIDCGDVRTLRFCLDNPEFLGRVALYGGKPVHEEIDAALALG